MNNEPIPADAASVPVPVSIAALAGDLHVTPELVQEVVAGFVQVGLFERTDIEPLLTPDVASTVRVIVAEGP